MKGTYTNWGSYPRVQGAIHPFAETLPAEPFIPRGNARSYGDASLGAQMVSMLAHAGQIVLDETAGTVSCHAGTLLTDVLKEIVPKGFFLPVVPGTKYITVGGAIGCDIHGKNHEKDGTFGQHLVSITMQLADGSVQTVSPENNAELFYMTCGGMGLTGIILSAEIRLKRVTTADIQVKTITTKLLTHELGQPFFENTETYSVGWVDALNTDGKFWPIVYQFGEHVEAEEATYPIAYKQPRPINVPFYFPKFVLSKGPMTWYNRRYYKKAVGAAAVQNIEPFFWPLDKLGKWNRIYGRNGFTQYQLVVPDSSGTEGLNAIFQKIIKAPIPPFLIVFKRFGEAVQQSPLSFPMKGYTLAIDFKMHRDLLPFLNELDALVLEMGGRLYLGKDARMGAETFHGMYPEVGKFKHYIHTLNGGAFRSALSDRIGLTGKNA